MSTISPVPLLWPVVRGPVSLRHDEKKYKIKIDKQRKDRAPPGAGKGYAKTIESSVRPARRILGLYKFLVIPGGGIV